MRHKQHSILATALLAVVALLGAGLLAPEPASAQLQKIRMTQPVESLSFFSVYVARANGYFADEGVAVDVIMTGGGGPDIHALLAGDAGFTATATGQLVKLHQEGKKVIGVQNVLGKNIMTAVMRTDVAKAKGLSPTTSLQEKLAMLKGLTIGGTRPGALSHDMATYFVRRAGLVPGKDVQLIGTGTGAVIIAALEQKKIDLFVMSTPVPEEAIQRGIGVMFINTTAGEVPELAEFLQQVLAVTPEYARRQPDTVRKMVRALTRANQWIVDTQPEQIMKAMKVYFPRVQDPILLASIKNVRQGVIPDGRMTERGVMAVQEVMEKAGLLKRRIPWTEIVTNEYLPKP
ncbi:MAG: ABC transporter substrate-binding protein [Deltaproteobacteria bacterium]|nr:ABC transporter substrate-binding protein [Deltaproteobacteria bacterium]MBI3078478.1 ABC transporter substrate-binding protein [Deltaproteobacteria bacterium]